MFKKGDIILGTKPDNRGDRSWITVPIMVEEITDTHVVFYTLYDTSPSLMSIDHFTQKGFVIAPDIIADDFKSKFNERGISIKPTSGKIEEDMTPRERRKWIYG